MAPVATAGHTVRRLGAAWIAGPNARVAAMALAVSVISGAAIASGYVLPLTGAVGIGLAVLIGLFDWRLSILGLLVYIPFAGIPQILLYPSTGGPVLVKDFLFVLPAYAGFFGLFLLTRRRISFRGAPLGLFLLLAVFVLVQALNPSVPNLLTGLIGIKVWLFYVPLFFLGYHLITEYHDLHRLLAVMSISAIVPAAIGIIEAFLLYGDHQQLVYSFYGSAAPAVTQDFSAFETGGEPLQRVSSTFPFVAQYYAFTVAMVAVTYAWWRGVLRDTRWARFGAGLWVTMVMAALLTGARGAFLFVPLLVGLILVFEGRGIWKSLGVGAATMGGLLLVIEVLGTTPAGLLGLVIEHGWRQFIDVFVYGLQQALDTTWIGLGTGIDTNAARYGSPTRDLFSARGGLWYESWWVKTILELGVAGLALVVWLFASLMATAGRSHARLRDPRLRAVSAAIIALLVWNLIYNLKAQYMDIDPMNVYFWLLAGVLMKLPSLEAARAAHGEANDGEANSPRKFEARRSFRKESPAAADLRKLISCPDCRGELAWGAEAAACGACGREFSIVDGIPVLLPQSQRLGGSHADDVRDHKERQAAYFDEEAEPAYEVARPHGAPALHGWLVAEKLHRSVSSLEPILPGATALTICGGSGMDAEYLASKGARVIASDISLGAAKRVAERARRYGVDIEPIVADAERLPFRDRAVDVVYVHDGLHHLERTGAGIAEMARVAGTAVSINEPAQATLTRLAVRLGGALAYEEAGNRVSRLDPGEVAAELRARAYKVLVAERYGMYYRHEAGPLSRWLSRRRALPAAKAAFGGFNAVAARAGNKLTVQAVRPGVESQGGSSKR